ncbi:RAVE subunit 2/Rogdi [Xylariaceae sp. FL0804]|nr:RAVE subunit 2/Rogdi [Xylariaceae sp. FL0804]
MSVEIWPPIAPHELKVEEDATQVRELAWLLSSLRSTLRSLRHGLDDCYALLAPSDDADPAGGGSSTTLALTTPRAEAVKGHVTRVGTRIVRGTVHLRMRTLPPQTLALDPARPVRVAALQALHARLTDAVRLAALCEGEGERGEGINRRGTSSSSSACEQPPDPQQLADRLRTLARLLADAQALIKGGPEGLAPHRHPSSAPLLLQQQHQTQRPFSSAGGPRSARQPSPAPGDALEAAAGGWTRRSVPLTHFVPPLSRNLSFYLTVQDAALVLHLRALEPADAPMNLGAKLAFAIGTARRLEHDEAERVFSYRCCDDDHDDHVNNNIDDQHNHRNGGDRMDKENNRNRDADGSGTTGQQQQDPLPDAGLGATGDVEVFVREKVRVESADPSLLSMAAKLGALSHTLDLARRNLAAVMGSGGGGDDEALED